MPKKTYPVAGVCVAFVCVLAWQLNSDSSENRPEPAPALEISNASPENRSGPLSSNSQAETRDQLDQPDDLPIPEEIDFAAHAFSVTEGSIIQGGAEDVAPDVADPHPSVIREKVFTFTQSLRSLVENHKEGDPLPQVQIPLFDGELVDVQFVDHDRMDDSNGALIGTILDTESGEVVLGYSDDAQAGTIRVSPDEVYSLFSNGNGEHRLVEVDMTEIPPCSHGHSDDALVASE